MNQVESSIKRSCALFTTCSNEISSRTKAMHIQECKAYSSGDYLSQGFGSSTHDSFGQRLPLHQQMRICKSEAATKKVDAIYRGKLSNWCFQVADHCQIDHETVGIAISYLDRFLSTKLGNPALQCRKTFQLATMTSLYMAVKIFEHEVIEPSEFALISRGVCTEKDITDMEMNILFALGWRVQPPTALSFVRHFLALISSFHEIDELMLHNLYALSQLQINVSVNEYYFVSVKPSTVAVASILNSADAVANSILSKSLPSSFVATLRKQGLIWVPEREIKHVQDKLLEGIAVSEVNHDDRNRLLRKFSRSPSTVLYQLWS